MKIQKMHDMVPFLISCHILLVITLQICYVWIVEYLGGPTFEWLGPIFRREDSRKYAHPPL